HAGQLAAHPRQAALHGGQAVVPALVNRDADHPGGDAVEIDNKPGPFGPLFRFRGVNRTAARARSERGEGLGGQRDQVGADAEREGQVERVRVVDRVKGAAGQERQVQPVEREDRVVIGETAICYVDNRRPGIEGRLAGVPGGRTGAGGGVSAIVFSGAVFSGTVFRRTAFGGTAFEG